MDEGTRNTAEVQPIGVRDLRDPLQAQLRGWIRSAIETLLREELDAVLQATRYAREADGTGKGIDTPVAIGSCRRVWVPRRSRYHGRDCSIPAGPRRWNGSRRCSRAISAVHA